MSFQLNILRGRLNAVMETRKTKGDWKIRDFILEIDSTEKHPQHRKMQGVMQVIEHLEFIPIGSFVEVEFQARGKRYKKEGEEFYSYYNIDEARKITVIQILR